MYEREYLQCSGDGEPESCVEQWFDAGGYLQRYGVWIYGHQWYGGRYVCLDASFGGGDQ
jgi:hypothetical protein